MWRRILLAMVCIAVSGVSAADPVDPDWDSIGIYFDEGGEVYCGDAPVGSQVTAYLCLTRPNNDNDGIAAWEAAVEVSPGGAFGPFFLRGSAVNASTAPDFLVTMGEPLPWALSVVLVELTVHVNVDGPVVLRVWPPASPSSLDAKFPLPAYTSAATPDVWCSLGYSFGWDTLTGEPHWCAGINDPGCLDHPSDSRETSWGQLRSLYR